MSLTAPLLLWAAVAVLALVAGLRGGPGALRDAGRFTLRSGLSIAPRLVLALLAAAFLSELVPSSAVAALIGGQSGLTGILIATLVGGLLPGGPMTSFPIAVFVWGAGGGIPQMVALLAGWSVFAFHRVLAYEIPMMGWRFAALRLLSVAVIPPLAGGLTYAALALLGEGLAVDFPGAR